MEIDTDRFIFNSNRDIEIIIGESEQFASPPIADAVYTEMNEQVEETLRLFANKESTIEHEYVWVPIRSWSYAIIGGASDPKRIEVDIIKQWIIDNNYSRIYLQRLIDRAIEEVEENSQQERFA